MLKMRHYYLPPLACTHTVYLDTPRARVSPKATASSHRALTEPQLGLTTLIQGAAELRGVPVHSECLSFLTLRHGVWTLTTACGDRRVTTAIKVPPQREDGASNQPTAAFWGLRYLGIRTYLFILCLPTACP